MRSSWTIRTALVLTGFCAHVASANVGDAFGFGSRSASLAGAAASWGFDGYAAYSNPAGLPLTGDRRLVFSWSLFDIENRFEPIRNVVIENDYASDRLRYGDVDNSYQSTFGQAVGLSYLIFPDFHRFTIGLVLFVPNSQLAYVDTGETFIPEYVLYRDRTQRPQLELAVGAQLSPAFYVGAGFHGAFGMTTNATVLMQTKEGKPSTMRFATSIRPKIAPYLGLLYAPGSDDHRPGPATFGLVFRFPVAYDNDMTLNSGARILGTLPNIPFNFNANSALYYDPLAVEIGASLKTWSINRVILQADYQVWTKFTAPAIAIQKPTVEQGGINISPGANPSFGYKNIWIPRIGDELEISEQVVVRAGYGYRPSIFTGTPSGAGNYLDPPRHMINLGLGLRYKSFLGAQTPCNIDFHASYDRLVSQIVNKDPGDEVGTAGALKIGAPGYTAGGKLFGGGVSVTLAF